MTYITEPSKKLKVYGNYDVVVAGAGPAGIAAAVSASKNGAKNVIIIEQTGALGGLGTQGLVPSFISCFNGEDHVTKGIAHEVVGRLTKANGSTGKGWPDIDAEKLKVVYDDLMEENKVKILFFTSVSDVLTKKDKVTGIVIENKDGRQVITGKTFVDATGDADVSFRAGVPCEKGGKKGEMQGVSVCFTAFDMDFDSFRKKCLANKKFKNLLVNAEKSGKLDYQSDSEYKFICPVKLKDGRGGFNFGHVFNIDGTKTEDLTYAMIRGRKIAHNFMAFANKYVPGMKKAKLSAVAPMVGVRETRRIKGEYKLVVDDYTNARHFKDNIAVFAYPIDVHVTNKSTGDLKRFYKEWERMRLPPGKTCGIPFRSLLPVNFSNLIVPGRALSSDRLVQGSARVMPICFSMGEAAGTAAAIAKKDKVDVKKVNIARLQAQLVKQGARIF